MGNKGSTRLQSNGSSQKNGTREIGKSMKGSHQKENSRKKEENFTNHIKIEDSSQVEKSQSLKRSASRHNSSTHLPAQQTKGTEADKNQEIDDLTEMMMRCLENADMENFVGLCAKCKENIIGHENGCKALGDLYHVNCFVCQKCRDPLVKKPFYHTDGLTYCERDYLDTLEKCDVCQDHIKERILRAVEKRYHPECFKCTTCSTCLDGVPFTLDADSNVLCVQCYNKKFAYPCAVCGELIVTQDGAETFRIIAMDKDFHVTCYKCEVCQVKFTNEEGSGCYPLNDRLLCHVHYKEAAAI